MIRREPVPELKRIPATRIVAVPSALDAAHWPEEATALRIAPDEVLLTAVLDSSALGVLSADSHAIVALEEGFAGAWLPTEQALDFLERSCEWELPRHRPAFAQGAVAGVPLKLWFEQDRVLFLVPAPYAIDLEERMS
jgi:hypothetical protein